MATAPRFQMPFDPMTIEHFGLRLYSTLPPVISELVSNAFDADSPRVDIELPDGPLKADSFVRVRDYGHGMSEPELRDEYLPIGRCRRGADGSVVMSKGGKRHVTGRKGLGKLSAFGVADEMELRTIQKGHAICLRFSFTGMKAWASKHGARPYEPEFVAERSGKTNDKDGVEVRLRRLRRKSGIDADEVRRGLARRLRVIGPKFQIFVNGKAIQPGDRLDRDECPEDQCWEVDQLPDDHKINGGLTVSGWIGFLEESSQANRGVDIFASEKAVELGSFFNYPSTHAQFARAHLVGEVHADFLDAEEDLVATARNSVVWESEKGQALEQWGQKALKYLFDQWLQLRRTKKEEEVTKAAKFDVWLSQRPRTEQRVAKRMVKLLVDDDALEPSSLTPLLEIVKGSVESVAFRELVETIEDSGATATTLLRLFGEWRVIEARRHLELADGRLAALRRLEQFMESGALEVQEVQPLFEHNLWMIDASWTEASGQTTYTQLLRDKCKEPKGTAEEDRRLDILGISAGGVLTVVELKRPEKTLSREDLEQIEKYVDWARENLVGTGDDAINHVRGLLIVGKTNSALKEKVRRLDGDAIRVQTFRDLRERVKRELNHTDRVLRKIAPEYSKEGRKKAKSSPVLATVK